MPLFPQFIYRLNRKGGIAPFGPLERLGNVAQTASAGLLPVGAASADLDCPPSIVAARPVFAGRLAVGEAAATTTANVIHGATVYAGAWEPHSHCHGHRL